MKIAGKLSTALAGLLIALAAPVHASPPGAPPAGNGAVLEIEVRDSVTGRGLQKAASVAVTDQRGRAVGRARGDAQGPLRRRFEVPPGLHRLSVEAPGYGKARANLEVKAGQQLPVKVWLDPERTPKELRPDAVAEKIIPGKALLHGHVTDEATGEPVDGAVVRLERSKARAVTDESGYFALYGVPEAGLEAPDPELPSSDNLVIRSPGFKTHRIVDTPLIADGNTHFIVELQPGTGTTERDDTHKLVRHARAAAQANAKAKNKD